MRFATPTRVLLGTLTLGLTASMFGAVPAATATTAPTAGKAVSAPVAADLFTPLDGLALSGDRVRVHPDSFSAFTVDTADLRHELAGSGTREVSVPDPSGSLKRFSVVETAVGEPGFEALHPEIRTFAGNGIDDPTQSIALDLTPMGFHASVRGLGGQRSWYVDPAYNKRGETRHISYYGAAVPRDAEVFVERDLTDTAAAIAGATENIGAADGPVTQKSYRLALVTDPSYATYFGAANVTAEKATLINRVNQVYMDDLAIKFLLIATNDQLNLNTAALATTAPGPCGANACFTPELLAGGCTGDLLDRNSFVTGQIVGADKFDIGHIGLGINGGGVAGLGVVGGASKAQGCTGLPTPEGDFFAIDYVAHEMGHQMGGDHTFNGTQVNCSTTNRALTPFTTQVEPGSGSSVMAYAGICGQDNLQPHSDPYFSAASIDQITDTVADDTSTVDEEQVVNLKDFDGTDAFTISCTGCATSTAIANGSSYNLVQLALAITSATGTLVTPLEISGYDGGLLPSASGFTVDFMIAGAGTDVPTLIITPTVGTFTTRTGVINNGGPTTNEGASTVTTNKAPVVVAPADKTLPIRTPFTLTGSGSDDDGNPLVYLWEQVDPGGLQGTGLVDNNKTEGPLFRVFGTYADVSTPEALQSPAPDINLATASPSRTFPDLPQILKDNTNAETGTCPTAPALPPGGATNVPIPTIDCYSEFLPTAGYANSLTGGSLNFRLSARDQVPTGGGYAYDEVTLTLSGSAGPFAVTSQAAAGLAVAEGAVLPVTWAVNGTNAAALAPNVKISLSTDAGLTFPTVLLATTPNDGTQSVTLPAGVTAAKARIKIEAVGNYFFDVNDADFKIGEPTGPAGDTPETTIESGPAARSFVTTRKVTFVSKSSIASSTFVCKLDNKVIPCAASSRLKFREGTHVFSVAAKSPGGVLDPTPATRVFASPFNDGKLSRDTKLWKRVKDKAGYRGAFTVTNKKGQKLSRKANGVIKVALVAYTGPGYGRVAIMRGKKRLAVLNLSSSTLKKRVLIPVALRGKKSGKFTILTLDNKEVRIDGLGLLTG